MDYTATYRSSSGAPAHATVEATNEKEAHAKFRSMGITPISVRPGKAPTKTGTDVKVSPSIIRGIVAALIVVVLAGGACWWLLGHSAADVKPVEKVKVAKVQKPSMPRVKEPKQAVKSAPAVTNAPVRPVTAVAAPPEERHDVVSIHTNNMGKVVEKWIGPDGKLHMAVRYARRPAFTTASDTQLAMAVAGNGTQALPPIPMTAASEKDFLESLKTPIEINDDDPENVKQMKVAVQEARAAMKEMMDKGMSYQEALTEHRKLVNENVETRNKCMSELRALVDAGDKDGAEHYLRTINIALGQMGVPALEMPRSHAEILELRAARRAEKKAQAEANR